MMYFINMNDNLYTLGILKMLLLRPLNDTQQWFHVVLHKCPCMPILKGSHHLGISDVNELRRKI